ncbi:uncharacterized protein LOC132736300 [Ruditapes philippinarum]|uniref:uncharacterized protein LOC132736300 n=1 Tax=Ruditapes philippinarum TaxID=129788 RepID=UPI00295B4CFA|nr:uncharacterized protein LOC132736300 [Ruditapes philippinarum]
MSIFLNISIGLFLSWFCQRRSVEAELSANGVYELLSTRIDNVIRENNNLKSELKETKADLQKQLKTEAKLLRKILDDENAHMKETRMTFEQKFKSFQLEILNDLNSMNISRQTSVSKLENSISKQNMAVITMLQAVENKLRSVSTKQDRQEGTFSGQISALSRRISVEEARKVAFSARLTKKQSYYGKDERIVFDEVKYSYGGGYSSSTGIFTAPKSGTYLFTYNIESTSSGMAHVSLMIDSRVTTQALVGKGPDYNGGNSAIAYVWKGEKVWVETASFQDMYYIGPYRTTFNGILID